MSFTTSIFLFVFFPLWIFGFFVLERVVKKTLLTNLYLLGASIFFYAFGAGGKTALALCLCCLLTKVAGDLLSKGRSRRALMLFVLLALSPLFVFKYFNFLLDTIHHFIPTGFHTEAWIAPLGISFITFSVVSYLVDVYRGEPAGSWISGSLYLLFFPKLISGPIVPWKEFRQKWEQRRTSVDLTEQGVRRMIAGFAKKTILADSLGAVIADITARVPAGVDSPTIFLLGLCMTLQIYLDFSGYSDIALGLSNMLGVQWEENFHYPYLSQSVSEFWRRWHISLGSWFRNYVYIPLGGNRRGNVYANLFIVFALTGLWHGARWNMVAWGCVNGLLVMMERFFQKRREKKTRGRASRVMHWAATMVFVYFSWMLFMAPSFGDALHYWHILFFSPTPASQINFSWAYFLTPRVLCFLLVGAVGSVLPALVPLRWKESFRSFRQGLAGYWLGALVSLLLMVLAILFMVNSTYSPFLYFQY